MILFYGCWRRVCPNSMVLPHLSSYNRRASAWAAFGTQCLMSGVPSAQLHTPPPTPPPPSIIGHFILSFSKVLTAPQHFRFHKTPQESLQPHACHFHFHNFPSKSASAPSCPTSDLHLFTTSCLYQDSPLPALTTHPHHLTHVLTTLEWSFHVRERPLAWCPDPHPKLHRGTTETGPSSCPGSKHILRGNYFATGGTSNSSFGFVDYVTSASPLG